MVPICEPYPHFLPALEAISDVTDIARRSECVTLAKGNFKQDIPSLRLDSNTTSDIAGDPAPVFVVEDNFGDCEQ